jgi:hypothetical protein
MTFCSKSAFWRPESIFRENITFPEKLPRNAPYSIGSRRGWRAGRQKVILEQKSEKNAEN